ncbi:MAG: transposase [Clostridia bacterium]|nr:transposase [Clostridia bacterium]
MQQFTTYGAKIHMDSAKPVQAMIRIYRNAVSFLIRVCMEQWEEIAQIKTLQARQMCVERLIHHTTNRPTVVYEDFDKQFYKLPSYIRRSAISEAVGKVESYQGNLRRWEKEKNGKAPGKPEAGYTYPVLYRKNMYERTGEYTARIKVWIRNTWDWMDIRFRKSDADYIARHCSDRMTFSPTVIRKGKQWFLQFSFSENVSLGKKEIQEQVILAVDLGINNACACSAMKYDGTVVGRKIFRMPAEEDCLNHQLNRIRKEMKQGHRHFPSLWASIESLNRHIAVETARFIMETATGFNADGIVFEHLDPGKKKSSRNRRQRLHMWKCRDIQSMVTCKAHRLGIRTSHVCAWNTSALAFDGSGKVERGIDHNHSICRFTTGKVYNCDLNASYNIGARYYIREILKTMPVTAGLDISAKVPECSRRSTCTLSTLISLNAVLTA